MTRLLLRTLNTPALILMALIGVAIQTSVFAYGPLKYIQPDITLLLVVWFALRRDFIEGGILTLITANISELHSSAPQGLFLITHMLVFLGVRGAARVFVIPHLKGMVMVVLASTFLAKMGGIGLLQLLDANTGPFRQTLIGSALATLANGILGQWAFRNLERFDWITYKNVKADQILEDEYHSLDI